MKAYQFAIYTVNPQTNETGWDIEFRTIFANERSEAREALRNTPLFDCVILFNYCTDVDMANLSSEQLTAIETGYTDNPDLF